MGNSAIAIQRKSEYAGCCVILTTKHQKSSTIAPVFDRILGAGVREYIADTDTLGTFSGEVERKGNALECVKRKCEWGISKTGADYGLASEGSFGPHPYFSGIPANREVLYFIDKNRKFSVHVSDMYMKTNYRMDSFSNLEELNVFADKALFPSHALIVRPFPREMPGMVFKGIDNKNDLEEAFKESMRLSQMAKVWVETDMRAHMNPTRMKMIGQLSEKLANQLCCVCPKCKTPGWGEKRVEVGLPCAWCGTATEDIKNMIYGCTRCNHIEKIRPVDAGDKADPGHCPNCNP